MKMRWWLISLAGLAILVPATYISTDAVARRVFFNPRGSISNGSFLGVAIGSPRIDARTLLLAHGFEHYEHSNGGRCHDRLFAANAEIDIFTDRGVALDASLGDDLLRNGTVCVISYNGIIREILWFYGGP